MFGRKSKTTKRRETQRRFLSGVERLENRNLLSGSPWQNPMACNDLNDDGSISASDALVAINAINSGSSGQLAGKMTAPTLAGGKGHYFDANGDGSLSASDALSVINALNTGSTTSAAADDTPKTDQQPDEIGTDVPELTLTDGFARVRSGLDTAGDVDVFRVTATTTTLNVALFSRAGGMTVSVVDAAGTSLGTASTAADDHHPATLNATLEVGGTYYITVSSDTDVTGGYCLQVIDSDSALPPPRHDGADDTSEDQGDDHGDDNNEHPQPEHLSPADLFAKLDADTSGSLSLAEFSTLSPPKGATETPAAVFTKLDADANGALSLEEFVAIGTHKSGEDDSADDSSEDHPEPIGNPDDSHHGGNNQGGSNRGGRNPNKPPEPADVFEHLDTNSDDLLSSTEFAAFRLPPGVTTAIDALFTAWDTDTNSILSLTEFEAGLAGLKKS